MITIEEFKNVELKLAKVLEVKDHPNADRLYVLTVDLGAEKRQIVAGIKKFYTPEQLLNKDVVVVANLTPAIIRGVESQGMLLAARSGEELTILTAQCSLPSGAVIG